MNGVIIFPTYLKKYSNYPIEYFWYAIRDLYGFKFQYSDEVDVLPNTDVVIMFGVPYHNRPKIVPGILDLNKKTKLIMAIGDVQCYNKKECLENKIKVYERCDLIIASSYEYFANIYPQFLFKFKFLGESFCPHDRYVNLSFNDNPKLKCLLSGSIGFAYPLRSFIKQNMKSGIDYRNNTYAKGDKYAELLHSYFCCVTCSSIFSYAVTKHLEIPASGSLLLCDETKDLNRMGFIPYKHYIPITKDNVFKKIKDCLVNSKDYNKIRKEGMEFVRKHHSINNRVEEFKEIFSSLMENI
jgi:hypothetical protein